MQTKELTAEQLSTLKHLVNATIHELVFVSHLAEENEREDASDALATSTLNLSQILEILES